MIRDNLREFIDRVTNDHVVSEEDVRALQGEVLADGLASRLEAEALLTLDRTLDAVEGWGAALTRLVVDFVVWKQPPNGVVSNDDALWLATVLDVGGPTPTAMNIAYAILDEAGYVDMALLDFIMRGRQQARLSQMAA
ncbi:hypothetical protein [Microvirga roseola]|uniref:hypothetical protein n=1 Tax=Microvirga roseola TaxID=2883126 RepID=UPI001E428B0E|nr:hypothetical protein [Microvirga roseola]